MTSLWTLDVTLFKLDTKVLKKTYIDENIVASKFVYGIEYILLLISFH